MLQEKLNCIIKMHGHWLAQDVEGWGRMCADLRDADLRGADLMGADLRRADLRGADLRGADLKYADLRGADLKDAELSGADLREAELRRADLRDAELSGADLRDADLRRADLRGADLRDADLRGAEFSGADLRDAKNIVMGLACPDSGSFIAWKKCVTPAGLPCIVKLEIPEDAKRSSATTNKCRADKALVLGIESMYGEPYPDDFQARSIYYKAFKYKKGELLKVEDFDENRWCECSTGIHFFINRIDAFNC